MTVILGPDIISMIEDENKTQTHATTHTSLDSHDHTNTTLSSTSDASKPDFKHSANPSTQSTQSTPPHSDPSVSISLPSVSDPSLSHHHSHPKDSHLDQVDQGEGCQGDKGSAGTAAAASNAVPDTSAHSHPDSQIPIPQASQLSDPTSEGEHKEKEQEQERPEGEERKVDIGMFYVLIL